MLKWLGGLPFGTYIVSAVAVAGAYFWMDYQDTKQDLVDQRELTKQWQHAAETVAAIQQRDTVIIRASERADEAIREAPNANAPISPDVAAAWAAAIDSVREAGGGSDPDDKHVLPGPDRRATERRGTDGRSASPVLKATGNSVPTL